MSTLINIIFDRSGSMNSIASEAVGMFNSFLKEQQSLEDYAELSLIQFDNRYQEDYICKPIKECKNLILGETYIPRGMTSLYDAIGKTINTVSNRILTTPMEKKYNKILFIIITDGEENNSKEFTNNMINKMMDEKKEFGWDFIFMASGISAEKEGEKIGVCMDSCASYDFSSKGIKDLGTTMSSYTTTFRTSSANTKLKVKDFMGN